MKGCPVAGTCDVAVVGGGPAGATVARILANWGFAVLVVSAGPRPKSGEVIGPDAEPLMGKLGLLELLDASAGVSITCNGVVSHWPSTGIERHDFSLLGKRGWLVDRARFDEALKRLAVASGCRWLDATMVTCSGSGSAGYILGLRAHTPASTQLVRARFVVDASGRPAVAARRLGARRIVDDRLIAASRRVAPVASAKRHYLQLTATSDGWWYRTDGGPVDFTALADPCLQSGRPSALRDYLGSVVLRTEASHGQGSAVVQDASSTRLQCCASDGWLAVGDAAVAFDPICGQGLAQALGSALAAAHALRERVNGSAIAFAAYDHAVQATYRHSRAQLRLRYAFIARTERTPFWVARARAAEVLPV